MFKKLICICFSVLIGLCLLCGCGGKDSGNNGGSDSGTEEETREPVEKVAGRFYTLGVAYENGWLGRDALLSIAYYHNGGREYNEELMTEDYEPIPKSPEELDEATRAELIQAMWDGDYIAQKEEVSIDDVGFLYYGCYQDCVALRMICSGTASTVIREINIEDICFYYSAKIDGICDDTIRIWIQN